MNEYTAEDLLSVFQKLRVIYPLLLLESKLACLRSLSQVGRQDEKHAKLMVLVIKEWLTEQLSEPRSVFRAVERLVALMTTPDGLNAFSKNMNLWDAIPIDEMKSNVQYEVFFAKRYSQLVNETDAVRSRAE